jgi:8-oxo-dGTP pyrophosphatase MutT (NUDIX family)
MPHPKVQVVVFAANHQVLLLQTATLRGSFWQNVTGSVEPGETNLAAAARELLEETSFTTPVRSTKYQFDFEHACYQDPTRTEICREEVFYTLLATPQTPRLDPLEHQKFTWQALATLAAQQYKFATSAMALASAYEICRQEHPELTWPPLNILG